MTPLSLLLGALRPPPLGVGVYVILDSYFSFLELPLDCDRGQLVVMLLAYLQCGLQLLSDHVCIAECTFADFDASVVGEVRQAASVSLRRSLFAGNSVADGVQGGAVLSAHADSDGGQYVGGFRLEGCSFTDNVVGHAELVLEGEVAQGLPMFFSDTADVELCSLQAQYVDSFLAQSQCVEVPLAPLEEAPEGMFLPVDSELLTVIKEVSIVFMTCASNHSQHCLFRPLGLYRARTSPNTSCYCVLRTSHVRCAGISGNCNVH